MQISNMQNKKKTCKATTNDISLTYLEAIDVIYDTSFYHSPFRILIPENMKSVF